MSPLIGLALADRARAVEWLNRAVDAGDVHAIFLTPTCAGSVAIVHFRDDLSLATPVPQPGRGRSLRMNATSAYRLVMYACFFRF
jgi:hypothetical protein